MEWIKAYISTTTQGLDSVFNILLDNDVSGAQIIDHDEMNRFLQSNPFAWDYVDEALLVESSTSDSFQHNTSKHAATEAGIVFYVIDNEEGRKQLENIRSELSSLANPSYDNYFGNITWQTEKVNDADWLDEWKKYYKPFRIGQSVVIVPKWESYEAQDHDLVFTIDPGSVFGTGQHQTTQLCVEALEMHIRPGQSVLDIGCGSGILSLIALLLGAAYAVACDFDPAASTSVKENAELNQINSSRFDVLQGDIFKDIFLIKEINKRKYDIIVANIVADVVVALTPIVYDWLKPLGLFISSGIISERLDEVLTSFANAGYTNIINQQRDGWHLVCGRRHA